MSVVFDSDILTFHEVGNMMKHYSGVLKYPLLFKDTVRSLLFRCNRFPKFFPPAHKRGIWSYSGGADSIEFTTNKPILLHGGEWLQDLGDHKIFRENGGGDLSSLTEYKEGTIEN